MDDEYEAKLNFAHAQEHVPEAECNIQVIKEHVQAAFHCQPFQAIPAIMKKCLAMEATCKLIFFHPRVESHNITAHKRLCITKSLITPSNV